MECWGAQGGNSANNGSTYQNSTGLGAYTCGIISLSNETTLYLYVGEKGGNAVSNAHSKGGYNGGGSGAWDERDDDTGGGGGGATDIRLTNGDWDNFNSLKSRIMVAAGAGGKCWREGTVGYGGGLKGGDVLDENGNVFCSGATQTSKIFGKGENTAGKAKDSEYYWAGLGGGGGGYYGGNASWNAKVSSNNNSFLAYASGSGGSSFISGHTGCNAISESSTSSNIIHTDQPNHYSGKVFTNTVMKAGNESMPSPTGGTETGHSGNGYCKITWHPAL